MYSRYRALPFGAARLIYADKTVDIRIGEYMKVMFVSLGCDKNLVDTESMLGILRKHGYGFTDNEFEADVIVVNTCCFIDEAKQESVDTILSMAEHKKDGACKALIVAGCLAHRYKDEILKEMPEVDAYLGTTSIDKVAEVIDSVFRGRGQSVIDDVDRVVEADDDRVITTAGYYEYLKIAEGCDKRCTYCIIPYVRGSFRSFSKEHLIEEAKKLANAGTKELILVAQETTLYGVDIYGHKALPELLHELAQIDGIEWIRLLYCYPEEIDEELIEAIKSEDKVLNYIDMPIQSASDHVLKMMGRRTGKADLLEKIDMIKSKIPDIALRTSLISGFPGETEEDHKETLDFVKKVEFDRLGVFTYSREDGTPAAKFEGQVDEEVKQRRRDEIMQLQQQISLANSAHMVSKTLDVLIEGKLEDEDTYVGRTYKDAPDVDGLVFVSTEANHMSGDLIKVTIEGATDYDLVGRECL